MDWKIFHFDLKNTNITISNEKIKINGAERRRKSYVCHLKHYKYFVLKQPKHEEMFKTRISICSAADGSSLSELQSLKQTLTSAPGEPNQATGSMWVRKVAKC